MNRPQVWAPNASQVEIEIGGRRSPMLPLAGGWWEAPDELAPGTDYAFCLDGGPALPDPRSRWQPQGVHGPSRWVDHGAFAWDDAGWQPPPWERALVYEIHVGTFTVEGTFEAAIARLPHLAALGVTHIEIMPVAEFAGERGWGYDGVDLYAPHHAYGGPEGLKRLVAACHRQGLAVLLDVVYNHLGPVGNYLGQFGPYFTERYHTPWGAAVNLDGPESDEVRAFLVDNARQWLRDYHMDGLRLDAVHALLDRSATPFLEELAGAVGEVAEELGRPLVLIAESDDNDPRLSASPKDGGMGLTAQWNEDFHHAVHATLTGEAHGYFTDFAAPEALAAVVERGFWLDGRYSRYRRRRLGRPAGGGGARFVAYVQNHDQVGNRARGERLGHLLSPTDQRLAAALLFLAPFVPLLFQGEEWGASAPFLYFTDFSEPALAEAVRVGRARESRAMGWPGESVDPQMPETFTRSLLRWSELGEAGHAEMLAWYRALARLRQRAHETHVAAEAEFAAAADASWMRLRRGRDWVLAANRAGREQAVALPPGEWRVALASAPPRGVEAGSVELAPESVVILARPALLTGW